MMEIRTYVSEETKKRAEQAVENDDFSSEAEFFRAMIEAGDSRIAELDPRTQSDQTRESQQNIQQDLLNALTEEYQPIEDAIEPVVEQYRSSVAHTLSQMADDETLSVEHDPLKGYRVNE